MLLKLLSPLLVAAALSSSCVSAQQQLGSLGLSANDYNGLVYGWTNGVSLDYFNPGPLSGAVTTQVDTIGALFTPNPAGFTVSYAIYDTTTGSLIAHTNPVPLPAAGGVVSAPVVEHNAFVSFPSNFVFDYDSGRYIIGTLVSGSGYFSAPLTSGPGYESISAVNYASNYFPATVTHINDDDYLQFKTVINYSGGANGDPQFTGFMGQSFQVHGTSGSIYNVLSSPSFQYNALFEYLESGRCRKGTQCFSHPGNYFGSVGVQIKDAEGKTNELLVQSGTVDAGLTLTVNNQTVSALDRPMQIGGYTVSLPNQFGVLFESDQFNIRIQNSDYFLNQDVSIGSGLLAQIGAYKQAAKAGAANAAELKAALPHGILGQTWSTQTYPNRWKHIEGQLFDYEVADGVMGEEFKYNRF